jgi:steroid 5-alpha reductase family enzyme
MVLAAIIGVLIFMTAVMLAGWLVQRRVRNGGWSDVFWTFGTGAAAAVCALMPIADFPAPLERRLLITLLVAVWSLRLGVHIARRVASSPEDARYAEMRQTSGHRFQIAMLALMLVQAPVTAVLALSVLVAAHAPGPLGLTDVAAVLILAIAIAGEGLADVQLNRFKARPDSRGKVCDEGLWATSRHPNYVFESIGWLAYPVAALGFGLARPWFWLALGAPGVMYLLLTRVSGVPPLERAMLASRGEAYRRYQAKVPAFFPRFRSGDRS